MTLYSTLFPRAYRAFLKRLQIVLSTLYVQYKALSMPRDKRHRCWCGGTLTRERCIPRPFERCVACFSFVNTLPLTLSAEKELYGLTDYWYHHQRAKQHPTIEEREECYRKDGRLELWLDWIEKILSRQGGKRIIELGCAPGVLLVELRKRGYEVMGVEFHETTAHWIEEKTGIPILAGGVPGVRLPPSDLVVAFDVMEHARDPYHFLLAIKESLKDGKGSILLQTPIALDNSSTYFVGYEKYFDPLEHHFLFSRDAIELLATRLDLKVVNISGGFLRGHELCVMDLARS